MLYTLGRIVVFAALGVLFVGVIEHSNIASIAGFAGMAAGTIILMVADKREQRKDKE